MKHKIIELKKTSFVRKKGKNIRYSIYSIIKSKNKLGIGKGKSKEFNKAIKKSITNGKNNMINIPKQNTIKQKIKEKICKTTVKLIPNKKNNGIIANGVARKILTETKIKNLYCKILGSKNKFNVIKCIKRILLKLNEKKKR